MMIFGDPRTMPIFLIVNKVGVWVVMMAMVQFVELRKLQVLPPIIETRPAAFLRDF